MNKTHSKHKTYTYLILRKTVSRVHTITTEKRQGIWNDMSLKIFIENNRWTAVSSNNSTGVFEELHFHKYY